MAAHMHTIDRYVSYKDAAPYPCGTMYAHSSPVWWLSRCVLQICLRAPCAPATSLVLLPRRGPKDNVQCCCAEGGCLKRATLRMGCKILVDCKIN